MSWDRFIDEKFANGFGFRNHFSAILGLELGRGWSFNRAIGGRDEF